MSSKSLQTDSLATGYYNFENESLRNDVHNSTMMHIIIQLCSLFFSRSPALISIFKSKSYKCPMQTFINIFYRFV